MRTALALMALICGGASAHAATPGKWCSDGFDQPATLTLASDNSMSLDIGGRIEHFGQPGSEDGVLVYGLGGEKPNVLVTALTYAEENEVEVLIFRDRAFWPCKKQ